MAGDLRVRVLGRSIMRPISNAERAAISRRLMTLLRRRYGRAGQRA